MKTLRGRIGITLLVFGLTTLITAGAALWVSLRDLHRDAALGSLAEVTVPYAARARRQFPLAILGPLERDGRPIREVIERFRETPAGQRAVREFADFVKQAQAEIDAADISVMLIQESDTYLLDRRSGGRVILAEAPALSIPTRRGDVTTGTTTVEGLGQVLYAATPIREPRADRAIPALVLVRADDSARLATADLVRALSLAGLLLLVVGIPLAAGLSGSVTRPLRRLATASSTVAAGKVPNPLPTTGPIEVAEATAAFNAMAAEVDATREAQRQLLADLRHDLRTPLTVIGGFAEALRDGTASGDAAERAAAAISDEAGRLERMLDDLDHLTVQGVAGPPLRLESIDGTEIASSAVARFAAEAESRGQTLSLAPGTAAATLAADRDALDRILGNLIANALTHAPSPGGHVTLEVTATGPEVTVAVRDDGAGIPTAALPHVFDRFYRADPSRTSRGSGLGLAIVRDLAEALGGHAFAENLHGGGARVGVLLPAAATAGETPGAA